jgi:hypothetical protein
MAWVGFSKHGLALFPVYDDNTQFKQLYYFVTTVANRD